MATLKLLSSMAPRACLAAAIDLYEKRHTDHIETEAAGGVDVARRIEAGEKVDVVVLSEDAIHNLGSRGHLDTSSVTPLMTSGIAVAVRLGSPAPELGTEASVKAAVLAAPSISFSTGPSGRYLESQLARWGILEQVRTRILVPPPGIPVAQLVADGRVALGFQQLSEMLLAPGIQVVGPLPAEIQQLTVFTGAATRLSQQAEPAKQLLRFLGSEQIDVFKGHFGMTGVR